MSPGWCAGQSQERQSSLLDIGEHHVGVDACLAESFDTDTFGAQANAANCRLKLIG